MIVVVGITVAVTLAINYVIGMFDHRAAYRRWSRQSAEFDAQVAKVTRAGKYGGDLRGLMSALSQETKQTGHVIWCDANGCQEKDVTFCNCEPDMKLLGGERPPACVFEHIKLHRWTTIGDDNFCPKCSKSADAA